MKRALLACTTLGLFVGQAHAQMAVIDAASLVNTAKMVESDVVAAQARVDQLVRLKQTFDAVKHGDLAALQSIAPELGLDGLTMPLGTDMANLASAVQGLANSAGATAGMAQSLLQADQLYTPNGGDFRALAINQAAVALASQKAIAEASLQSSAQRLQGLNALRNGLGPSPDIKAAADATARMTGEQATATAQGNQLLATMIMQNAQTATDAAREQQMARCGAERLMDAAKRARTVADAGTVQLVTDSNPGIKCNMPATTAPQTVGFTNVSFTNPGATATTLTDGSGISSGGTSPAGGAALDQMTSQPWGQQASDNATALGINPAALAATCVLESNCTANPGGTGTISGAFQMSNGTYAQTVGEVQASNPDLASQITSKNDPASQSIAAAQYLKDGALSLQAAGIANPSVLDVRGYYNFGPANSAALASASGNQLMSDTLSGLSPATLRANGISDTTTVSQWRNSVTNKIGAGTASQSVLNGITST